MSLTRFANENIIIVFCNERAGLVAVNMVPDDYFNI